MSKKQELDLGLSDAVPGLGCPRCGQEIYPGHSGDALHFYCRLGHEVTIRDLAGWQTKSSKFALDVILQSWELTVRRLESSASDAQARGLHSVAEIFHRQIGNLEARIQILRAAVKDSPHPPSD